jgi:hypothetical protein
MEAQWSDRCNDPRVASHLQTIADRSFASLLEIARSVGVDVAGAPFDEMDGHVGKPRPNDPTRPMVTLKTSWNNARQKASVQGRWHDNRHTLVTDLAESGAGDETIRDIAGHVSKQMLKHYSHIRMEAKRRALEAIVPKQAGKEARAAISAAGDPPAQIQAATAGGNKNPLVN